MLDTDARHGTIAGYSAHTRSRTPYCDPCRNANFAYKKRNKLATTPPRKVDVTGSRRRVQALQALGWSRATIAARMGYTDGGSLTYITRSDTATITTTTASRLAVVYEQLSAVVPTGPHAKRARTWARRSGFAPPLAWDNIDDPDEVPAGAYQPRVPSTNHEGGPHDEAAVIRILSGDWRLPCTPADKREVVARWTLRDPMGNSRGVHENEWDRPSYAHLERLTGWKVARYHLPNGAA